MTELLKNKEALPSSLTAVTVKSPEVKPIEKVDTEEMERQLEQTTAAAKEQQEASIDYAAQQGVQELQRAEADAREQFQVQRDQIDIDEAKALDNQALYAEARGDRGGIGQAQYGSIQNTAARNRLTVSKAQTQLSVDTARQVSDLRTKGEFEKADALLTLTQNYLSQLTQLQQWAQEYNLSVDEFNAALGQWEAEYTMEQVRLGIEQEELALSKAKQAQDHERAQQEQLSDAGWSLLESGILPSDAQLAAMGLTKAQAESFLAALQPSKSGSSGGSKAGSPEKSVALDVLKRTASAAKSSSAKAAKKNTVYMLY